MYWNSRSQKFVFHPSVTASHVGGGTTGGWVLDGESKRETDRELKCYPNKKKLKTLIRIYKYLNQKKQK